MEFQKINPKEEKEKRKKKKMRQIKNKQLGERLKPNHINNYVKQKYSKHTYEKAEIVQLDKKDSTTY